MHFSREEFGKETFWWQTFRSSENLDASEIHARRLNGKEVLRPKRDEQFLYSQSQMEQPNCLEEIMESEKPL